MREKKVEEWLAHLYIPHDVTPHGQSGEVLNLCLGTVAAKQVPLNSLLKVASSGWYHVGYALLMCLNEFQNASQCASLGEENELQACPRRDYVLLACSCALQKTIQSASHCK